MTVIHDAPDGDNINRDCGATHPESLMAAVRELGADVGFALDGDADRCIAVDARGRLVDGDQVLGILALERLGRDALDHGSLVVSVLSNGGLQHAVEAAGGRLVRTPVGDKHILAAMLVSGAGLGGEKSGHVIVREHALTGDGIVTALELLRVMGGAGRRPRRRSRPPSRCCPSSSGRSGSATATSGRTTTQLLAAIADAERRLAPDGRILVRPSGHRARPAGHGRGPRRGRRGRAGRRDRGAGGGATTLAAPMCGIVGYTGPREAGPILIEGLRRLEYRGYDSAGIALVDEQGDLFVEKKAGKLANLQTAIADRTPHAALGLAHTRWATHGRPNDLNAHPHQDCTGDITVIHNGIIENFRELRDELEARGHVLTSETDTEAIAHLVEEAYQGDLADAVRAALRRIEGAYALVVMHKGEVSRLVGARHNVPLVVGLNGEESFIASDVAAILAHTDRVVFLEDGDIADVRPDRRRDHRPRRRTALERPVTIIDWTPEAAEKGGYAHFMLKEIHEQPDALRQSLAGRVTPSGHLQAPEVEASARRLPAA